MRAPVWRGSQLGIDGLAKGELHADRAPGLAFGVGNQRPEAAILLEELGVLLGERLGGPGHGCRRLGQVHRGQGRRGGTIGADRGDARYEGG